MDWFHNPHIDSTFLTTKTTIGWVKEPFWRQKNKDVYHLNCRIQIQTYVNCIPLNITNEDEATNYSTEFLNSLDVPYLPPHSLQLNVGSVVIMLCKRNQPKLCNGTRLMCNKLIRNLICARVLKGKFKVLIPRYRYAIRVSVNRISNSSRIAMTINKSQGQSLRVCSPNLPTVHISLNAEIYIIWSLRDCNKKKLEWFLGYELWNIRMNYGYSLFIIIKYLKL